MHATPATHAENLKGSFYMVVAMAGFAINDLIVKYIGQSLNLGQTLLIRGIFATVLILVVARMLGQWRPAKVIANRAIAWRVVGEMIATGTFVYGLFHMPIANATAILQALPLAITLAAAFFLREKVGWRRISAALVGFSGVLIIVRPGMEGFNIYSVLILVAVVACVLRDLSTRLVPRTIPGMMISFATAISVTLLGGVISLFEEWRPVEPAMIAGLAACSLFLVIGYNFVVFAMRGGDVGFVTPFRYSILLFSIIGGYFVFNALPDMYTSIGSFIVVATGIYTLYRERSVRRQAITQPPQR